MNLAGAGIGDHRWTPAYKQTLLGSRTTTTSLLARTVARLDDPPVLVNSSAIGAYGSRKDEVLTEASTRGDDFLAGLVKAWENATTPASDAGARVVWLRSGVVLAPSGGALGKLLPILRLGLGGPLGSGRQWWSWITLTDEVAAIRHVIGTDVAGPVNAVAPEPTTNRELTRALAQALHRPAVLRRTPVRATDRRRPVRRRPRRLPAGRARRAVQDRLHLDARESSGRGPLGGGGERGQRTSLTRQPCGVHTSVRSADSFDAGTAVSPLSDTCMCAVIVYAIRTTASMGASLLAACSPAAPPLGRLGARCGGRVVQGGRGARTHRHDLHRLHVGGRADHLRPGPLELVEDLLVGQVGRRTLHVDRLDVGHGARQQRAGGATSAQRRHPPGPWRWPPG